MAKGALPVTALVLAAGLSRRMGRFKLLMPWGERTVIGQVVDTLVRAGLPDIAVVTGHRASDLEQALEGARVCFIFNARFADGEMIDSIQAGLAALDAGGQDVNAVLLCLGDQPQMSVNTARAVLDAGGAAGWERIIIPSYHMSAGHPILLPRWLWPEVIASDTHLNAVLKAHHDQTIFLTVEMPTVLDDIDTPEDYAAARNQEKNHGN